MTGDDGPADGAQPDLFGAPETREQLQRCIQQRREQLQQRALRLGRRLYAEGRRRWSPELRPIGASPGGARLASHVALGRASARRSGPECASLSGNQYAYRFQAQGGLFQCRQTVLALLAQRFDFAVTHARVDGLQGHQSASSSSSPALSLRWASATRSTWRGLILASAAAICAASTSRWAGRTCWRWRVARFPADR